MHMSDFSRVISHSEDLLVFPPEAEVAQFCLFCRLPEGVGTGMLQLSCERPMVSSSYIHFRAPSGHLK